ncbi:MAG: glycosyltransferase family 4 protein [Fimbriimonadaceae bacterium]|nr:glycosyltransferase family 4 protein [Fimbriimonadaceae bacterium]QYK55405.1 MAG: glycosyltransferase family 4 protein [Fimbriimonadaceae bacterium]
MSSSATSGAEHHCLVLARRLAARGHSVEVVCPPIDWMQESLAEANIPCHPMDMREGGGRTAIGKVSSIVRRGGFSLIHSHLSRATYLGAIASAFHRVPLVSTVHVETREPIYRFITWGSNRIIAVSNYIHGVLKGRGVRSDAIDVVYNGTDFADRNQGDSTAVHREFGIPEGRRLVGLVGRIAPEKGHHIALEAFANLAQEHTDTQLMFVGRAEGDFPGQLREEVTKLGLADRVTFTGDRSDVARLFDAMEFSILPTVMESFGLAVIECMARGRPVVASKVGALGELIEHGENGLLVEQTSEAFAHAMRQLLADPVLVDRMGRLARIRIQERFTVAQMVERIEAVYYRAARLG